MTYNFEGKTFLITGGAGFIGSNLVHALLSRGAETIVLDDFNDFYDPAMKESNIAPFLQNSRFKLYREDIRSFIGLRHVFERHARAMRNGGIIHLAARAGVRPSLKEPRLYLDTNVTGTLNLAELAREFEVKKFVFASSSSVYGDCPAHVPFVETQDVSRPISPYASTKVMGESLLHSYSHLYNLQVVALRFFTVYGAGQRPDLAIHKFTRLISNNQPVPVFGDGSTQRDYTFIDDIVHGVLSGIQYDQTPFEVFNLGESQTTSLSALIGIIEQALGKSAILERHPLQPGDVSITCANIGKARQLLGYAPKTMVEQGIPKFIEWYCNWHNHHAAIMSS
jgi:UDP-glucuronate 4-epimerase